MRHILPMPRGGTLLTEPCTGVPRSYDTASSWDPTVGLCLGPHDGPRGGAAPCQRGTPEQGRLEIKSTRL